MDYLKAEFGDLESRSSIDIDSMFEGRVFAHKYNDGGLLRNGTKNPNSIYFYSSRANVFDALKDVIDKIRAHYEINKTISHLSTKY